VDRENVDRETPAPAAGSFRHGLAAVDDHGMPATNEAASEHGQSTAAAISSGFPIRPVGSPLTPMTPAPEEVFTIARRRIR
jgi:hypothetical protein